MAAKRHAEAFGILDTLLRAPLVMPDEGVRARLYRAQCLEALGRPDEARTDYLEFLRIWKDADPGTPELAVARTALTRLDQASQAVDPSTSEQATRNPTGRQ